MEIASTEHLLRIYSLIDELKQNFTDGIFEDVNIEILGVDLS